MGVIDCSVAHDGETEIEYFTNGCETKQPILKTGQNRQFW